MRPTYNEINLRALRYNLEQIRKVIPKGANLISIVKANAYGHGAVQISRELEKCGEKYFGVATVGEALELRQENIKSNILILGSFYPSDIDDIFWHKLTPVCYRKDHLECLEGHAKSAQTAPKIHVKFDTGMGRLGFEWEDAKEIAQLLKKLKNIEVEGLMSHLAVAEEDNPFNALQIERFEEIKRVFSEVGVKPKFFHLSNSSGLINKLGNTCNLFRPGLALYGSWANEENRKKLPLKQLMNLRTEITQVKELEAGRSISYGRTYITSKKSKIAVLPIGYADGYDTRLSNKGRVIVRGEWAYIVGRVCMDMLMINVTDIEGVEVGDQVTLMGSSGEKFIPISEIASTMGSIPYEVMCGISERVVKKHIHESSK